jgi:quercetin dioxygenase-like cupin family protein
LRVVAVRAGDSADIPGFGTQFLLTTEDTAGRFALIIHTISPRSLAAPTHTHANEDEYSFVLSGTMGYQLNDQEREAGPGELVVKPRGIPHAFWNPTDEETRVLELISPAGFEEYFARLQPILSGGGPPDLAALAELQAEFAMSMDPTTIGPLAERHGLVLPGPPPPS